MESGPVFVYVVYLNLLPVTSQKYVYPKSDIIKGGVLVKTVPDIIYVMAQDTSTL